MVIPSHLLQMRGLKLHVELKDKGDIVSHLLQMRGLKQIAKDLKRQEVYVASFTDAWIETPVNT